jgi:PAS domain S-box-containing protein
MTQELPKVLFLSDRDALRGPIAEALASRSRGAPVAVVLGAGLDAAPEVHPAARAALEEAGAGIGARRPRALGELRGHRFDLVVTLSPAARHACSADGRDEAPGDERLPLFVGTPIRVHWSVAPPALEGAWEAQLAAARQVRDEIGRHVAALVDHGYLAALATERRRTLRLLDALDVGLLVHDEQRRVYLFNTEAERLTGYDRDQVLGRNCHEIFAPDGICGSFCAFRDRPAPCFDRRDVQVSFLSADGTERRLRMLATPMELHEGRPVEVVAQLSDVTEIEGLRRSLKEQQSLHGLVGESPAMRGVFEIIRQVAASDYPVLIEGESGTGKELAARAIHSESRRAAGPFVPINCGALPEHILESELFGHVRGAFTGAIRDKKGRFELAHGGTIFLDEVGELSPAFQVKLLRVLQEMRFERVGGEHTVQVDVRVISATNRDLGQLVQRREFREDLFYRLAVVPIDLPPLRDRRSDIPLLVDHILARIQKETGRSGLSLSGSVLDLLVAHRWSGNVRELINALQFAAVRCQGTEILPEHLPPDVRRGQPLVELARQDGAVAGQGALRARPGRRKLDAETVAAALSESGGNKVKAARLLGVGRATLYRFLDDTEIPEE